MASCLIGRLGDDRHVQSPADYASDVSNRHALVAVAMNRWRKAYHRHTRALRCHRSCCLLRSNAGMRGIDGIFFGREAARCDDDRSTGGDDQGAVRANERGAKSLDGAPIYLTVSRPLREVVIKGGVNHAV